MIYSNIIEKPLATKIQNHLINNDMVDHYKEGHSCDIALLRVYNYIVTTIGRYNGGMLVLSAALIQLIMIISVFILAKYIGSCGNVIKLVNPLTTEDFTCFSLF